MNQTFKCSIKNKLVQAANDYSNLLDKKITLASVDFEYAESYTIRFFKTNFLHLTGVKTFLSTELFFERCLTGTISEDDFDCDSTPERKGIVRSKMRHLPFISSFFKQEVLVQKKNKKGAIKCLIASSDGKCTLGFADAKYYVRPKTILDKNHLNKEKKIVSVVPNIQ